MPTIFPLRLAWAWREKLPAKGRSSNASLKKEIQNKIIIFNKRFLESAKAKLRQPRNRYVQCARGLVFVRQFLVNKEFSSAAFHLCSIGRLVRTIKKGLFFCLQTLLADTAIRTAIPQANALFGEAVVPLSHV